VEATPDDGGSSDPDVCQVIRLCDEPFALGLLWPSVSERFWVVP
jgi:hypothetical protein